MPIVFALEAHDRPVLLIVHVVFCEYPLFLLLTKRVLLTVRALVPDLPAIVTPDPLHLLGEYAHGWSLLLEGVPIGPVLFVGEVREDLQCGV